jgi:photosystem II PsbY protein
MDLRLLLVLAPLGIAAGWAFFNIGAAAIRQLQNYLGREA